MYISVLQPPVNHLLILAKANYGCDISFVSPVDIAVRQRATVVCTSGILRALCRRVGEDYSTPGKFRDVP